MVRNTSLQVRGVSLQALRLYLVTDRSCLGERTLSDVVAAAVQGGVTCVQLREKQLNTRDFFAQAIALKALLAPHHIPLVINDRIDVALACGAQGVHLGQSDMPVLQARRLLPPSVFIGWSVETMEDVVRSATLTLAPQRLRVGDSFSLQLRLQSQARRSQKLAIDYAVHHVKADGRRTPKVFKGWVLDLPGDADRELVKTHSMREITTRRYHPGRHAVDILINGRVVAQAEFDLKLAAAPTSAAKPKARSPR